MSLALPYSATLAAKSAKEIAVSDTVAVSETAATKAGIEDIESAAFTLSKNAGLKILLAVATASLPLAASETEAFQITPSKALNGVDDKGARPSI
jgi:hypothetical protein